MKIIIVKKNTKRGIRFNAYYSGILSMLGIYCPLNEILFSSGDNEEECIKAAKEELRPNPKPNRKVVRTVEI